jgi:hypothetical protein
LEGAKTSPKPLPKQPKQLFFLFHFFLKLATAALGLLDGALSGGHVDNCDACWRRGRSYLSRMKNAIIIKNIFETSFVIITGAKTRLLPTSRPRKSQSAEAV